MLSSTISDYQADVAVVGGGITGLAIALGLAKAGIKVILLDQLGLSDAVKQNTMETRVTSLGYDLRVSAINEASKKLFEQLECWDFLVEEQKVGYIDSMHVWDGEGTGHIEFDKHNNQVAHLGFIVENGLLREALLKQVMTRDVLEFPYTKVTDVLQLPDSVQLTLKNGKIVEASLAIAADGAESLMRNLSGIPSVQWDYFHHALVTTVKTQYHHENTARQIFLDTGPLAFLPLSGDGYHSSIVWSATPDKMKALSKMSDGVFCSTLTSAIERKLGKIEATDQRHIIPLRQRHAKKYSYGRLLLIGDAAHTIHPLAGQGLNLGLADVAVLIELLKKQFHRSGGDVSLLGEPSVLAAYQRKRKSRNLLMAGAMECLERLFASDTLPLRWLRNTGLTRINRFQGIKKLLVSKAMGY